MTGQIVRGILTVLALAVFVPGCANPMKQRITLLEETNQRLTEQLNQVRGVLDAAGQRQQVLNQRLIEAQGDSEKLRAQLAEASAFEEPAPGWTNVPGGAMITIDDRVLFAPGKALLRQQARRTLDTIVRTVKHEYGDRDIMVFGHTDDRPIKKSGWKDNWELSTERALAVVRYLQEQGVSTVRLVGCGCGQHRPRVENSSDANRTTNRRVEILALDSQVLQTTSAAERYPSDIERVGLVP